MHLLFCAQLKLWKFDIRWVVNGMKRLTYCIFCIFLVYITGLLFLILRRNCIDEFYLFFPAFLFNFCLIKTGNCDCG